MKSMYFIDYLREGLRDLLQSDLDVHLLGEDIPETHGGGIKGTKGCLWSFVIKSLRDQCRNRDSLKGFSILVLSVDEYGIIITVDEFLHQKTLGHLFAKMDRKNS